jgi:hypothetical protein
VASKERENKQDGGSWFESGAIAGSGYAGWPGNSPDRADATVCGVSELMREGAEPLVRVMCGQEMAGG